jgi:hypothetical protein
MFSTQSWELENICKSRKDFGGVFFNNELNKISLKKNKFYIINENSISSCMRKNGHWRMVYIKKDFCYFFDSYGDAPNNRNEMRLIDKIKKDFNIPIIRNEINYQSFNTSYCGIICIFVAFNIAFLNSISSIEKFFERDLEKFSDNLNFLEIGNSDKFKVNY